MSERNHPACDSPQVRESLQALKALDFELAYLAVLTLEGIKPLSRWEKPLDDDALALIGRMGLLVRNVRRTVKTGKEVTETVFSASPAYVHIYEQRFANQPIDKSAETVRLEGFLFGYPSCCVEQYVREPYAPNDLPEETQKILFHWACKGCPVTGLLLPVYRAVLDNVEKA